MRELRNVFLAIGLMIIACILFDRLPPAEKIVVSILLGCAAIAAAIVYHANRSVTYRINVATTSDADGDRPDAVG